MHRDDNSAVDCPDLSTPTPQRSSGRDLHPADVIALLHKAGYSLRGLAAQHGLGPRTLNAALRRSSYPAGEEIIARALGKTVVEIWPERAARRAARTRAK